METVKHSYREALQSRSYKKVPKGVREVIYKVISVNDHNFMLRFYKNEQGDFRMDRGNSAYSNFQIKCDELELLELAQQGKWDDVRKMIDSGVQKVWDVFSFKLDEKKSSNKEIDITSLSVDIFDALIKSGVIIGSESITVIGKILKKNLK